MKDYIHSGYKAYGLERKRERDKQKRVGCPFQPMAYKINKTYNNELYFRPHSSLCILFNIFKLFLFV